MPKFLQQSLQSHLSEASVFTSTRQTSRPDSCLPRSYSLLLMTHSCVALWVPTAYSPRIRWLGEMQRPGV